jgi:DNA-binding PadR family transcriptional regulator
MTKAALTSLEVLLLALVEQGCNTPYRLKEDAGISVGAALPALNRLKSRGLLERATQSARNKQEFEVTARGKKAIVSETKRLLAELRTGQFNDVESALRLAALTLSKNQAPAAESLLKNTGLARRQLAKLQSKECGAISTEGLASIYRTMNGIRALARSAAEAEALVALADQISRRKIRKS